MTFDNGRMPRNQGSDFWEAMARACLGLEDGKGALKATNDAAFVLGFMHGVSQARRMQKAASRIGPDALHVLLELMREADELWSLDGYFDLRPAIDVARALAKASKKPKH